jgi:tetratricopeptide (TPR) repeat protein/predicted Ser/Thr protein kinase
MLSLIRTIRQLAQRNIGQQQIYPRRASAAAGATAAETPGIWGSFFLEEEIARGGFGQVYRAWDPALERWVALKLLNQSESAIQGSALEEGRLLARLRNPHVAAVYGADVREGRTGIWMELVHGKTLEELVSAQGPMGARETALVGVDICTAVAAVHAAGIIHRDIKAQNVMREQGGRVVLIDFGLGQERMPERDLEIGELCGTPLYMAPEMLIGAPASTQTDVYALGILFYFLASGQFPVEAGTLEELKKAHRNGPRRLLKEVRPELSEDFVAVVEKATAIRPNERYSSVAALGDALSRVLPGKSSKVGTRRRATMAAVMVATASGGWWAWNRTERLGLGAGSTLLVAETVNATGDRQLDGLTTVLRSQLGQSSFVNLYELKRVSGVLTRMGLPANQPLTPETAREVAWRESVPAVVFSTVSRLGSEYALSVQLERTGARPQSPRKKLTRVFSARDKNLLPSAADEASHWIRENAGESAGEIAQRDRLPQDATTPSWEALAFFSEAEHLASAGRRDEAILQLKEAVRVDPQFALALMRLGDICLGSRRQQEGLLWWDQAARVMNSRRLNRREELRIRAMYAYDTGDISDADGLFQTWAAEFPYDFLPRYYRLNPLVDTGRAGEALKHLEEAERLYPNGQWMPWGMAMASIAIGDLARARRHMGRLRELGEGLAADLFEGNVLFLEDRPREALEKFRAVQWAARGRAEGAKTRVSAVLRQALVWSELGEYGKALEVLEADLRPAEAVGEPSQMLPEKLALASLLIRLGRNGVARGLLLGLVERDPGPAVLTQAGGMLAQAGFGADAGRALAKYERSLPSATARRWTVSRLARLTVSGEILLAEGKWKAAIPMLEEAAALERQAVPAEYLARAYEVSGDGDRALALYGKLAESREFLWRFPEYYRPGLWSDALVETVRLSQRAGSFAGREDLGRKARQRLGVLRGEGAAQR